MHGVIVEDVFDSTSVQACGLVGECGDDAGPGFCWSLLIGAVLCAGEV